MRRFFLQAGCLLALVVACSFVTRVASPQMEEASQPPDQSTAEPRPDGATRLTTPPAGASDQNPAFSPDGSRLVFTRFRTGYNAGPAGLFLLNPQTGSITRLTPWEDQDNVNLPGSAWNPVNNRIVFASDRLEADDLWRIAPDGTDFSRISTHTGLPWDIEPSWSPDGAWIVFEADQPGASEDGIVGKIWKVRADGTALTALTSDPVFDDRQPNWSPEGDRILFQRRALPVGQWDIFTLSPDGIGLQNVTNDPASDTDASWSPDGKWIVYSTDYGGLPTPNIFVILSGGGQPVRITTSATREDGAPSWSPDSTWIAFESHPGQDEDTPASLWAQVVPAVVLDEVKVYLPLTVTAIAADWWRPPITISWQWQLDQPVDLSVAADVYDVDLFDTDAGVVAGLHAQGSKVICYLSAGSWEDWRPDKDQFPAAVLGNDYEGWPGEKWLDIRQIDLLAPILRARLDLCQAKGFDGVEPDNIDGYTNDTGFPLTYQDQITFNHWLATEAHTRGLSIGLKNDPDQAVDLEPAFDWALTEDCFAEDWCDQMLPFIAGKKPVFAAEYTDTGMTLDQFCPQASLLEFSAILKHRDLDAWREACP